MQSPTSSRASCWDRAVALAVDLLLINLLIAVIGLALTGVTGGKVRVANTVLNVVDCTSSEPVPSGLKLPDGFEAADARRCTRSVLGIAHDWKLVVSEKATAGEDPEDRRQITIPADRMGRPVQAFYLDDLILVLLGAYLLLLEWRFGATPGKYMVAIQVRSLGGAPLDIVQAGKRVAIRLLVLALPPASVTGSTLGPSTETHRISLNLVSSHGIADFGVWSDGLAILTMVYVISFIVATSRRSLPLHDRWAGTEVVRSFAPPSSR